MLWALLLILVVLYIAWLILSIPKDIPNTEGSVQAINNVGNWMTQFLGSNWPYVLSVIIVLLLVILYLLNARKVVSISDAAASTIARALSVVTIGVALLMTLSWRQYYVENVSLEYYMELMLILGLMVLNIYLV